MSVYDEILEKKKQDRIKYRLEQEERDNEDLKRKNDVYATKFYSMQKQIDNKDKEIERLNNIINELEKSLKELIRYSLECYEKYEVNWEERKCVSNTWLTGRDNYLSILNYLQRLKGNDKEYFYTTSKEVEEDLQELKGSDKKSISKEDFNKVWKDSTREAILNQYYYDYMELRKVYSIIKEVRELTEMLYKNEANIFYKGTYKKQLEILDKVEENK